MRLERSIKKRAWRLAMLSAATCWCTAVDAQGMTKAQIDAIIARNRAEAAADPGPEPDWQKFRDLAEAAIKDKLVDPDSARFEWPNTLVNGAWAVGADYPNSDGSGYRAWFTCGLVNARTPGGGFSGRTFFVAGYKQGRVSLTIIDDSSSSKVEHQCNSLRTNGTMTAAPSKRDVAGNGSAATSANVKSAFGLELMKVPDGIYVGSAAAGGAAAKAGVKAGMVIARLNGLSLKDADVGLVDGMLKSAHGPVKLEMIAGGPFTLGGPAK